MFARQRAVPQDWTPPTWEQLVRDHSDQVFRLSLRLTGNRHDAEDLTQDVFIKVFRSIHTFTPGTLEGWLHRITTNCYLDMVRRRSRVRIDPVADTGERESATVMGADATIDDLSLDPDVAAALAALPPEQRVAVVLCDVEGLSYEQVAEVLDTKLGTVRSRIHRGRTAMRAALAHREPTAGRERYQGVPTDYESTL